MLIGWDSVSELWPQKSLLLFIPKIIYEYGEPRWNDNDGKTEVLREKSVPVPLCPTKIAHGLSQVWTQTSVVGGQQLSAWAMALPRLHVTDSVSVQEMLN
jgi:hypothetical protein